MATTITFNNEAMPTPENSQDITISSDHTLFQQHVTTQLGDVNLPLTVESIEKLLKLNDPFLIFDKIIFDFLDLKTYELNFDDNDPTSIFTENKILDRFVELMRLPDELFVKFQENIDALALMYQLIHIEIFLRQGFSYSDDDINYAHEIPSEELIAFLKTEKNTKTAEHITVAINNFFEDQKELNLVSIDFTSGIRYKNLIRYTGGRYDCFDFPNALWHSSISSISSLSDFPLMSQYKTLKAKFDISDNPFVFVVNSALLHRQLFVLGFDLQSELTFIAKNAEHRKDISEGKLAEKYPHLEALLAKDMKMDVYIKEYVEKYSGLFQRNDVEMSQLLFGLHVYSKDKVLAMLKKRWEKIVTKKITSDMILWRKSFDEWFNENISANKNNNTDFGWA